MLPRKKVHMLSRASKILTLVPKHSQSSNDEESSDSSSEIENFNIQRRDSNESSSCPSLPSSLENLHLLSDDENNLTVPQTTTSCPSLSMKPASENLSMESSAQDSLHSVIPPSPTAIVNVIRNKRPRFNRIVPETPESSPATVAASPSPSNIHTRLKQPRLAVRRLIYGGEDTFRYHLFSPEEMSLGFGAKVVLSLCKTIPDPACSIVYFDDFFTSLELIHMLRYNMGIFSLGTIRSNRLRGAEQKLISDKALKKKGRGSYSRVVCNKNKVCIVKWHDKVVTVASSYVSETPVGVIQRYNKDLKQRAAVPCPNIIKHYNAHMGGVDLADMLVALYRTEMKSHRWYLPIFSQILDMCVNNSWILYRRHIGVNNIKRLSLKKYRHHIIQGLLHSRRQQPLKNYDSVPPAPKKIIKTPCSVRPTADVKYDGYNHFPTFGAKGRCKLCIKSQTTVMCIKCGMRLCLLPDRNCFFSFQIVNFQN